MGLFHFRVTYVSFWENYDEFLVGLYMRCSRRYMSDSQTSGWYKKSLIKRLCALYTYVELRGTSFLFSRKGNVTAAP